MTKPTKEDLQGTALLLDAIASELNGVMARLAPKTHYILIIVNPALGVDGMTTGVTSTNPNLTQVADLMQHVATGLGADDTTMFHVPGQGNPS